MRWRKQMSAMWDDEKVAAIVVKRGLAGFGLYCRVLDIVAAGMGPDGSKCSVKYPVSKWSHLLSVRGSHVRHLFRELAVTGLLTAEWFGSDLEVTIPKLLKYRDEYTQRSGETREEDPTKNKSKSPSESIEKHKENDEKLTPGKADGIATQIDGDGDGRGLFEVLELDKAHIPRKAAFSLPYLENRWAEQGKPREGSGFRQFLDGSLKFLKANGITYPEAVLLRLKQCQRGEWEPGARKAG
jgi:hypothetical protein